MAAIALWTHSTKHWRIYRMQTRREDNLEAHYAVKFCFKLGKNSFRKLWNALTYAFTFSLAQAVQGQLSEGEKRWEVLEEVVWTWSQLKKYSSFADEDCCASIKTISILFGVGLHWNERILLWNKWKFSLKNIWKLLEGTLYVFFQEWMDGWVNGYKYIHTCICICTHT